MARYSQTFAPIGRMTRAAATRRRHERETMERDEYESLLRTLGGIAVHQDTINDDLRTCVRELRGFNVQQVAINQDLKDIAAGLAVTQARIEALLARMIAQGDTGQEA